MGTKARTLFDKIWDAHLVDRQEDGTCLLYIDRHLVHEVTSPQAFEGLRAAGRKVRHPEATLAVADHNVPTTDRSKGIDDEESRIQVETLEKNAAEFGVDYFRMDDVRQGIVHIVGPEQGFTLPGTTSSAATATPRPMAPSARWPSASAPPRSNMCWPPKPWCSARPRTCWCASTARLPAGVTAKDLVLAVIGKIGTAGGTGHVIEYAGEAIRGLSMEGRMTVCNMSIEAGARAGLIAPDETTFAYLQGRPMAPKGAAWEAAVAYWKTLTADEGAHYDTTIVIDAAALVPMVTWGTSPEDVLPITAVVPDPADILDPGKRAAVERSLAYMGLKPGTKLAEIPVDTVFIGSCTNGRIEDLRAAAAVLKGRKVAKGVRAAGRARLGPGQGTGRGRRPRPDLPRRRRRMARAGLLDVPGHECRQARAEGERCASTSNRNFEGRQGRGGRTHLVSPAMAAAAAVTGHLTDVRSL